jgi:hypothetical protein
MSLSLQEVADLGGNDSDFELLQGVDSDQENDGTTGRQGGAKTAVDEDSILAGLQELLGEEKGKTTKPKKKKESSEPTPVIVKIAEKKDKGAERIERDKKVKADRAARKENPVAVVVPTGTTDKAPQNCPKKLLFEPSDNWYAIELPALVASAESGGRWEQVEIDRMYEKAKGLYESQVAIYKSE